GVAKSIELMLKVESICVYKTELGEEGVDLAKIYDYDIVLLDLNLPDMSGYEVLRSLRSAKVHTPILILSGLASIEDKMRASRTRSGVWASAQMTIFPSHFTRTNLSREFTPSSAVQKAMPIPSSPLAILSSTLRPETR